MELLTLAIIALVISLIAGVFGFTGIASGAASVATPLFGIFLVIAVVVFLLVVLGVSLVLYLVAEPVMAANLTPGTKCHPYALAAAFLAVGGRSGAGIHPLGELFLGG
jgi:uncharacterized membrane protein YtjA (UPF0391 family)